MNVIFVIAVATALYSAVVALFQWDIVTSLLHGEPAGLYAYGSGGWRL